MLLETGFSEGQKLIVNAVALCSAFAWNGFFSSVLKDSFSGLGPVLYAVAVTIFSVLLSTLATTMDGANAE